MPSISVSPTSAITSAMRIVTVTGTGTTWSTQDPQTLFTLTGSAGISITPFGPSGASIGSVVIASNTSATLCLVTGPTAGTLTLTDNSTSSAATITLSAMTPGTTYYISSASGSGGAGTLANPFLAGDLLNTGTSPVSQGIALTGLNPGDTLEFRAGTYHISGDSVSYDHQLICPTTSGTATQPITIRAYPGELVTIIMDSGAQPAFGTETPALNYVRFIGFTINPTSTYVSGGTTEVANPFRLAGTGNEVAYNEVIGAYVATTDNHDGIRFDTAISAWVHHNNVHSVTGDSGNSCGIKIYTSSTSTIEDNYVHGCTSGIFEKQSIAYAGTAGTNQNTYRRNWLTGSSSLSNFLGNNQGPNGTSYVYDNVVDGAINIQTLNQNWQVYNNLIRTSDLYNSHLTDVLGQATSYTANLWNNISITGGTAQMGYVDEYEAWSTGLSTSPLAYMDYNVYDGAPSYEFGAYISMQSTFTLSGFQAQGFETHASVAAESVIFPGIATGNYTLATAYLTAGRYSNPVGPRYQVSGTGGILDAGRYGPAALTPPPTGFTGVLVQTGTDTTSPATLWAQLGSGLSYATGVISATGGTGTVTSVGLSLPSSVLTVSGSPVTTTGTLTGSLATQSANTVWSGPTTGAAATPIFRALVSADLPSGVGTVTSVGLSLPGIITVSGSPVTTSGTLTGTLATQTANTVWAGPSSGAAAAPTFRAMVSADLPAGTGTVTSVALTMPGGFTVTGSPVTTSGTIAVACSLTGVIIGSGGSLSGQAPLSVINGGTGDATLTAHAVLLGEGTSAVAFATIGTAGRPLVDQGSGADPAFASTGIKIDSHYGVVTVDTPSAGAVTCNLATSDKHKITIVANTTITLSGATAGQVIVLTIVQGGAGSFTPSFSPSLDWGANGTPVWSTAAGKIDIVTIYYDGTTYYAALFGLGF